MHHNICIGIRIPNLPLLDQKLSFDHYITMELKRHNIKPSAVICATDPDHIELRFNVNSEAIVFLENNIHTIVFDLINNIPWSMKINWGTYNASRPILGLYFSINSKDDLMMVNQIPEKFGPILWPLNIMNLDQRKDMLCQSAAKLGIRFVPDALVEQNCAILFRPRAISFLLEEKYRFLGEKILSYFLAKEHLAHYQEGKCIVFVEEESNEDILLSKFAFAIECKLFDVMHKVNMDLKLSIESYRSELNNLLLNNGFTLFQQIEELKKIALLIQPGAHVEELFQYFKLDITSSLVKEDPVLENCITALLIGHEVIIDPLVRLTWALFNLLEAEKNNRLPNGSQDPWGIKKEINLIVNWLLEQKIKPWSWLSSTLRDLLENKMHKILLKNRKDNITLPLDILLSHPNLMVNKSLLVRCRNFLKNLPTELNSMARTLEEETLYQQVINSSYHDLENIQSNLENYINSVKIIPFANRIEILRCFLSKIEQLF